MLSAVVSGFSTSEHDLYPALHADLDASMLLMADGGFFSYTAWKDSAATGAQLLWRMRANNVLPVLEDLKGGSFLSAVYSGRKDRGKQQGPHYSSDHRIHGPHRGGSQRIRLITTLS